MKLVWRRRQFHLAFLTGITMADRLFWLIPIVTVLFYTGRSVVLEQRWVKGGIADCSFETNNLASVVVNSSLECLALMQPHSGEYRIVFFNKTTRQCSVISRSSEAVPSQSYITAGSVRRKESSSCQEVWEKVLEVASDGTVMFGDVARLISAVEENSYIRVHQQPNFYMEAEDILLKRTVVCGTSTFVMSKVSWDEFDTDMHWQFTKICTSGKTFIGETRLGAKTWMPRSTYSKASTWFVRKHRHSFQNPLYCNSKTHPSTCGDIRDLISAVKQGYEIRLRKNDDTNVISSYTPSRVELDGGNCRVAALLFWKVGVFIETWWDFRFYDPLYWWIRLFSTDKEYDITRWNIGDYLFRSKTSITAAIDWFKDYCWMFTYEHTASGKGVFGSLQKLIEVLLLGRRVRVLFETFSMEVDNILVDEALVTAQLLSQIDTETPIRFYASTAHLRLLRLSTNGRLLVDLYEFGSSTRVGQDNLDMTASWFVETRDWILVLRTNEKGVAVTGSKYDLEQAIRAGSRLRCAVHMGTSKRLIMTMDNIDVDTNGNVAAQFFRLIELENIADMSLSPYWRIIILTTDGKMKETRWTLGENVNRGNTVTSVTVDWFVDESTP